MTNPHVVGESSVNPLQRDLYLVSCVYQWCWSLSSSVRQLAIQSVTCYSVPPVMAVPINVSLCRSARYRHRYYTARLMALSDGLFTESFMATDRQHTAISLCVAVTSMCDIIGCCLSDIIAERKKQILEKQIN